MMHPPMNAEAQQSRGLSEVTWLMSGRGRSEHLVPVYVQLHIIFWDESILSNLRFQAVVCLYYFLKSAFYLFSILKENFTDLLCFHSSSLNYMKYQVPSTVDL